MMQHKLVNHKKYTQELIYYYHYSFNAYNLITYTINLDLAYFIANNCGVQTTTLHQTHK